jgi:5'-3' exonuclease
VTVKQDRVLLIDFMNTYIRSYMIIPVTNDDGEHFGGVFGFLKSLKAAVEKFQPTEVVVCCDGANSGLRRKNLFPKYKAHRRKEWKRGAVKAFDFLNEQEQNDNFVMQIRRIQEYLDVLPVKVIRIPYVEADDVIAIYAQELEKTSEVVIYSSDADFKQLVSDNIHYYNPISKQYLDRAAFREDKGIDPKNYIFFKSLQGDKSDGIPGIRGMGETTMLKLFPDLTGDTRLSIDTLVETANRYGFSKQGEYTPGQRNKFKLLAENADTLRLNYRLMQLLEPEISNQAREIITSKVTESPQSFNAMKLRMMFMQDKLEKTIKSFGGWAHTFAGLQTR